MAIEIIKSLLGQGGLMLLVISGLVLIVGGSSVVGRQFAGRLIKLTILLVIVSFLVSPDWLP